MSNILEFADVIDCLHNTPDYSSHGYPIIRVEDINNEFLDYSECLRVNEEVCDFQNKKYIPQKGDIIITRVGSFGMVGLINTEEKICLGQNIAIISPKKYGKFLYYYLQSPYIQKIIHGNSGGSSYKSLSLDMIRKLPMKIDNLNLDKIGDTLYKIDSKIDNNRKILFNIQKIMETTYYRWFIDFEFPINEKETYLSSNGKMEYSEKLKKEIPINWGIEKLSDVLIKKTNGIKAKEAKTKKYTPIDCLDTKKISFYRTAPSEKANSSLITYNEKDIIFGSMRPYFHRVSIAPFDGVTRTTAFVFEPKLKNTLGYSYETLNLDKTVRFAVATSKGTQQPYAVWDSVLSDYIIPKVPDELKIKYSKYVEPLINKALNTNVEIENLVNLKNFLLPILMNGQLKFKT